MSDSYDDYEAQMQLAEHEWEMVKTEHDRAVELGKAYERGWNAALAQREWVPEALRLADALDAEFVQGRISNSTGRESAVELRRLHEALEIEQEPVAWISEGGDVSRSKRYMDEMGFKCNPLYTAPPKREWVSLTDEDMEALFLNEDGVRFARYIEAKLREKNHG